MNRKGFTLVELLAVIVILIGISLIAVGRISSSLIRRENKEIEEQQKLAISAAKIYFSQKKDTDSEDNCVKISTLKASNNPSNPSESPYIIDNSKTNLLADNDCVVINKTGLEPNFQYSYSYKTSNCSSNCK